MAPGDITRPKRIPTDTVLKLFADRGGNVWFGIYKRDTSNSDQPAGIGLFDGTKFTVSRYQGGLLGNMVTAISVDQRGVWCAVSRPGGAGVALYDGSTWRMFTTDNGLPYSYVQTIVPDKNGRLLFRFSEGSVASFDGVRWELLTANGRQCYRNVSALSSDAEGNLWIINDAELAWYDGIEWHSLASTFNLPRLVNMRLIARDSRGFLWMGDYDTLWRFDGKRWQSFSDVLGGYKVSSMSTDNRGVVWLWSYKTQQRSTTEFDYTYRLKIYDGETWSEFASAAPARVFEDEKGKLWSWNGGDIKYYDGASWVTLTTASGLVSDAINDIAESDGVYWFATSDGISKYDSNRPK